MFPFSVDKRCEDIMGWQSPSWAEGRLKSATQAFYSLHLLVSPLSLRRSSCSLLTTLPLIFLPPGWSGQPARGSLRGGGIGVGEGGDLQGI